MYAKYFGLKQEPFSIAPDPRYLFMSKHHREALAHLLYGLNGGGGFVLLSGDIGAGKTTVCRCFLEQIPKRCNVAYIFNPKLTVTELLKTVCDEFGIPTPADGPVAPTVKDYIDPLNAFLLKTHAVGQNNVLIIDEAQMLSADVLEQLRLLTNLETSKRKLLQIILIGQPELRTMLARPELEQLAQRIVARFHLRALSAAETTQYIGHRLAIAGLKRGMPFDNAAITRIHALARGIPRRINLLCDRAMLGAYARSTRSIGREIVDKAAVEVFGRSEPALTDVKPARLIALGAGVALVAAAAIWVGSLLVGAYGSRWNGAAAPAASATASAASVPSPAPTASAGAAASATPSRASASSTAPSSAAATASGTAASAAQPRRASPAPLAASLPSRSAVPAALAGATAAVTASVATPPLRPAAEATLATARAPANVIGRTAASPATPPSAGRPTALADAALQAKPATQQMPAMSSTGAVATASTTAPERSRSGAAPVLVVSTAPEAVARAASPGLVLSSAAGTLASAGAQPPRHAALTADLKTALRDEGQAWRELAPMWRLDLGAAADPCDAAARQQVRCYKASSTLASIRRLGRPGFLNLRDADDRTGYVLLTGLSNEAATLQAGGTSLTVSAAALARLWRGQFATFWRTPPGYDGSIGAGASGPAVYAVATRLASVAGDAAPRGRQTMNSALRTKVARFQAAHGIRPTGTAGPTTLMQLNRAVGIDEPRLRAQGAPRGVS